MVDPYDEGKRVFNFRLNRSCTGDFSLSNGVSRYAISARYKSSLCSKHLDKSLFTIFSANQFDLG